MLKQKREKKSGKEEWNRGSSFSSRKKQKPNMRLTSLRILSYRGIHEGVSLKISPCMLSSGQGRIKNQSRIILFFLPIHIRARVEISSKLPMSSEIEYHMYFLLRMKSDFVNVNVSSSDILRYKVKSDRIGF